MTTEQKGRIAFSDLQATLLLIQPSIWLVFAAKTALLAPVQLLHRDHQVVFHKAAACPCCIRLFFPR